MLSYQLEKWGNWVLKKVRVLLKVTKLINRRNRARIQSHFQHCTDTLFCLSAQSHNIQTKTQTNLGRKSFLELPFKTVPLFPLESVTSLLPLCYFLSFFFFWMTVHTPWQERWCSPITSAEVWCLHYVCLGKIFVLWQSAENTRYKSEAFGKSENERNLMQAWGAESSFLNPCRKQNKTMALRNTFPSLWGTFRTICLPLNIFSSVLAEFQVDGIQSLFIRQAEERHEMGKEQGKHREAGIWGS